MLPLLIVTWYIHCLSCCMCDKAVIFSCTILWHFNQTLSFHSTYAIHFCTVSNTNLETMWIGEVWMMWAPRNIGEWLTHWIINDQLELGLWKTYTEAVGNICSMWDLGFFSTIVVVSVLLRCDAISHKNRDLICRVTEKKENHFENCLSIFFCGQEMLS